MNRSSYQKARSSAKFRTVKRSGRSALGKKQKAEVKKIVANKLSRTLEHKYWEYPLDSRTISSTPVLAIMSALQGNSQGTGDKNQRIGDSISMTSLHFKGSVSVADTTNLVRLICFLWKPSLADATPTVGDILSTSYSANYVYGYKSVDNLREKSVRILYDRTIKLSSLGDTYQQMISYNHKFKTPVKIQFDSGSTTNCTNCPCWLIISDSSGAPHPSYLASYRIYYTDA